MKKSLLLTLAFISFSLIGFSQTKDYNLESQNLHKNVRKTIDHYYAYDKNSGGFVKRSVSIKRYNDEGHLIETYYVYNGSYSEGKPSKRMYKYNNEGLMTGTTDVSDNRGEYSTENIFKYDRKGNLIRKESVYKDGSKYYSEFINDKKGRVVSKKSYSKEDKLTGETSYKYNGGRRTETRTSYSSKDGSIIGTYTTIYEDGVKAFYKSEGKYGTSTSRYEYDKEGNLSKTLYKGKTNSTTTYNYVYDKKDNWVKKHYRSGKYQYFYFREIYFKNGDISGSTNFDKTFINRHGNFANVAVVPIKRKKLKKDGGGTDIVTNNPSMPSFNYRNWKYTFVNMKDKVSNVSGKVNLNVTSGSNLSKGNTVKFKVDIDGAETKYITYTVSNYFYEKDKKRHFWSLKSTANDTKGTLCVFNNAQTLRGVNVVGLLMIGKEDNKISFYLQ